MTWIMVIAVFSAYAVKGTCGFANTLVFSTILSFTQNNIKISPVDLIVGYPANLIMAWKNRKEISLKLCIPLSLLVIWGAVPGALILKHANTQALKAVFGFVILSIAIEMLVRESQKTTRPANPVILGVLGIISGVLCGLFGIGALLAAYVGRTTVNDGAFKGNLSVVFCVENTFRLILYSFTGIIDAEILRTAVTLWPFMAVGLFSGMLLEKKINAGAIRKTAIIMVLLSGISLIVANT